MPFDGTGFQKGLVELFDTMLEFFGPAGERWVQGEQVDGHGNRCLIGALRRCRKTLNMRRDGAAAYLRSAIHDYQHQRSSIVDFNDDALRSFEDIRAVLMRARDRAIANDPSSQDARQLVFALFSDNKNRRR